MEPIAMSIEIGGIIPAKAFPEFYNQICDLSYDHFALFGTFNQGQVTDLRESIKNGTNRWDGETNYGECRELKKLLRQHKLSYIHRCEAKYEYDGSVEFWTPDMEEPVTMTADQEGCPMVRVKDILPLLTDITDPDMIKILTLLKSTIRDVPELPPLTIAEDEPDLQPTAEPTIPIRKVNWK